MNASHMLRRYLKGQNVAIEYHWLEGQFERLPALMADLVSPSRGRYRDARGQLCCPKRPNATTTIPIVFGVGDDPVKLGLVASIAGPDGNRTGIKFFFQRGGGQAAGAAARASAQGRSDSRADQSGQWRDLETHVAGSAGSGARHRTANSGPQRQHPAEIELAFATIVRDGAEAVFVAPTCSSPAARPICDALDYAVGIPSSDTSRDVVETGGLMSYEPILGT